MKKEKLCPDCGVKIGQHHITPCDVAQCTNCGGQLLSCGCNSKDIPWNGFYPGTRECEKFGWYAYAIPGGWARCVKDWPGAIEDLNRLHTKEAHWNKKKKRFVRFDAPVSAKN